MRKKNHIRRRYIAILVIWAVVFCAIITIFCIAAFTPIKMEPATYYLITTIVSFASFIATSFFGLSIYTHNAAIREQNNELRNQTNSVNKRAEAFRHLQFISSNYTIIDFVDNVMIFEESTRYTARLKETGRFTYYLLEKGLTSYDILENFNDYQFLTVKMPIMIIEGIKTISRLKIKSFKFVKQESTHSFVTAGENEPSQALILYNEKEHRSESVINLVMKKESDFYNLQELNNFLKIKINLEMESLLGVSVNGAIELYFTNPEKFEKGGASKYKINSSQFELHGMPKLTISKEFQGD